MKMINLEKISDGSYLRINYDKSDNTFLLSIVYKEGETETLEKYNDYDLAYKNAKELETQTELQTEIIAAALIAREGDVLDYSKITFNEYDADETPIQFFFNYDLSQDEIDWFLAYYTSEDDLDESKNVIGIELCLSMYSSSDFKLEAICSYDDGCTKDWIELWDTVNSADAFIEIIKTANTKNSKRAYALYQTAIKR